MKSIFFICILLFTLCFINSYSFAIPISLVNPSFENPSLPAATSGHGTISIDVIGWEQDPGFNQGIWRPYSTTDFYSGVIDGNNVAFVGPGKISQTTTAIITADHQYTLGVYVGN